MLTKILTPFSLPLVLEMPALKTCGGQRSLKPDASPSQQANSACNRDKPTASSYTLVTSAGPFSAAPGNLCSGPGWDPEDSSEQEQIHEELKHISPPLSSKAMVENNMWQWDPRAQTLISPLLWHKNSGKASPFSISALRALPDLVCKSEFIWGGKILVLFSTSQLDTGCSTISWSANLTIPHQRLHHMSMSRCEGGWPPWPRDLEALCVPCSGVVLSLKCFQSWLGLSAWHTKLF